MISRAYDIEYPLLANVGSEVIRAFGILNTNVPEDVKMMYGMAWPGNHLLSPDGIVVEKTSFATTSIAYPLQKSS